MTRTSITVTTEIDLSIEVAAKWFCGLDDDLMARFLDAVATEAQSFTGSPDNQWYYLGGHLKNCACIQDHTREMIRSWAHFMETSTHGVKP